MTLSSSATAQADTRPPRIRGSLFEVLTSEWTGEEVFKHPFSEKHAVRFSSHAGANTQCDNLIVMRNAHFPSDRHYAQDNEGNLV